MRAGTYVQQRRGYRAFIPAPLPPSPPVHMTGEMNHLLSRADRALGRLDGAATVLPNPDLFVSMYVRQEALLSSQIEGTQSTLEEVLQFEVNPRGNSKPKDVEEVVNYVGAMNYGLKRLRKLPLSLRLIREVHKRLLKGVRGESRNPGEFRSSQNWVGPSGCTITEAEYVPPPPDQVGPALGNLEEFLRECESLPVLVQCGLAHAQFETIHPFLDGNGRVGRLLITLMLCERDILRRPLLYLSHYLKAHRGKYYDKLMAVRNDGDWEGWLEFFLVGVFEVSQAATETAREILGLRELHRQALSRSANALRVLDLLFEKPIINVRMATDHLDCSDTTARSLVSQLENAGILREITGRGRNRLYRYDSFLGLFDRQAIALGGARSSPSGKQ